MAAATHEAIWQVVGDSAERVVRRLYEAFARGDRDTFEALVAEDFRFTSPYDDAIDRAEYFERCWPSHARVDTMTLTRVAETPGGAYVTYEIRFRDGHRAQNTEWLAVHDHQVHAVEVYFGAAHGAARRDRRRVPGPEAGCVNRIVGTWTLRGHNLPATPDADATPVEGEETWVPMEGGFFVRGHWVHRFHGGDHVGVSVIGMEPERGSVMIASFDNLGYAREYRIAFEEAGRTWTLTGAHERATYTFAADGTAFDVYWESSRDGRDWTPLCRLHATRV
jgi:hypothetical protein